jgi:aminoglycoside phosphotransferase (APT) family kinase protein
MNLVLDYLALNRDRLGLDRYGVPRRLRCVLLTPRFRASSHVVFLLMPEESQIPALVAKLPRRAGMSPALVREAAALRAIQARRAAAPGSVPELVAFEPHRSHMLLVETAIAGLPLHPDVVRRSPSGAACDAIGWLLDVHRRSAAPSIEDPAWFERLVTGPLDYLAATLGPTGGGAWLVERTRELAEPLRQAALPLVLAHGDFAHPNLIRLPRGGLGAVDWELGEMGGLPAGDFFLFMAYAAGASARARSAAAIASSFHAVFCGAGAWGRPFLHRYFAEAGLDATWARPLCALAFARSLADLLNRTGAQATTESTTGATAGATTGATTGDGWWFADRRFALWQRVVLDVDFN